MNNQMKATMNVNQQSTRTKTMVYTALFATIATILYVFFEFPVPFFPEYLRLDFSDTIALIGGITLGPVAGIFIQVIKNIIKIMMGSYSGGIGEMVNALVGIALVTPAVLIYRAKQTNLRLVIGMLVGVVAMVVVAGLTNFFIALPIYMPESTAELRWTMVLAPLTPFNLFKGGISTVIGLVVITSLKGIFKYIKVD